MAFIKVCGMTDEGAVAAALAAGVDAIGFVFAPSVRRVTPAQAAQLALPARGKALCVAVTLHPDAALLDEIFTQFRPSVWQSDADDIRVARETPGLVVPEGLELWPVLRARPTFNQFLQVRQRVLFEGPRSGTGKVSDWKTGCLLAKDYEVILAGGLSPANVAEAIDAVRPFGVDVSSGVEEAPGRKSPALIESFVFRARAAFARPGNGEQ